MKGVMTVALAILALAAVPATAQETAAAKPATIAGTITAADTSKPLRRARVILVSVSARGGPVKTGYTNSRGEYQLKDVPPGSYYVSANRAGYIEVQYGQRHASERGFGVDVKPGAAVTRIDIALPRGSVITGRITDDLGEPYPGVRIDLLGLRYNIGKRVPFPVAGATTDDLGQFRISGVVPGSYYLMASSTETWRTANKETFGFGTSYFPGVPIAQAQVISVGVGEIKSDISFSLESGRAARLRGRVVRETGEPVANALVWLAMSFGVAVAPPGRTTRSAPDGSFEFKEVPRGIYQVGDQDITVSGADIDDVMMVVKTGSTVTGSVVTEDGTPPPFNTSGIRILTDAPTGKVLPRVGAVAVDSNWAFKLTNLGGQFLFRVIGLPDGWMLGAVRLGDKDITDTPWDIPTGGKEFNDLKIVVTQRQAKISGTVLDAKGQPSAAASVLIFSEDAQHWMPYSRFLRAVRPGADGQFTVAGLPAGTYRVVARDYIEPGQHEDRQFLEELRDEGTRVVVADGAAETVTLRLPAK